MQAEFSLLNTNCAKLFSHEYDFSYGPAPPAPPDIPPPTQLLGININPSSKTEIAKAIKSLKSGKTAGLDGIPPEARHPDFDGHAAPTPQQDLGASTRRLEARTSCKTAAERWPLILPQLGGNHAAVHPRQGTDKNYFREAEDKRLQVEQAGFRQDRSCTDHIATMRIIVEQSLEWQIPLYTVFVNFQKAFDSVDQDVIWGLMHHYGFPPQFVATIQQLCEDTTCQMIHNGKLTESFSVQIGVRQGCLLSSTIFLMVVDWVMRQSTAGQKTGIQWTFTKQLEDLDFADNISLLSHKQQGAQEKLCRVAAEAEKTGLQINIGKTEAMRVNNKQDDPLRLHQEVIKEVDKFVYLGSVVSKDGGTDEDIKCRTNKARHAFNTLRPIKRSTLSLRNKIRILNTNVKSVYSTVRKRGLWLRPTPTNCKHLPTDASGTFSTTDGLKLSQTNNCGTRRNKPQLRQRSESASGVG